jgi:hypothetical protein
LIVRVYTVTSDFSAPQIGIQIWVGDTIGKIESRVALLIGATEFTNKAFYDWAGSADSLRVMEFTEEVADPSTGSGTVKGGAANITSGQSSVTVVSAFGFVPTGVTVTVMKPNGGDNLFATVRQASITATGFIVDLSAPAKSSGYVLHYIVTE